MATFGRTETGVAIIHLAPSELTAYSGDPNPICDFCIAPLRGEKQIALVPILNQALCPKCEKKYVKRAKSYPEDAEIEARREKFWMDFYHLKEGT